MTESTPIESLGRVLGNIFEAIPEWLDAMEYRCILPGKASKEEADEFRVALEEYTTNWLKEDK